MRLSCIWQACTHSADVMEAAQVDGASGWQKFRYITLPLLKPMTLFVVITSIISYIQAYVQILIMTEGGPGTSTYLASYIIYDEAFVKYNFDMHQHFHLCFCDYRSAYRAFFQSIGQGRVGGEYHEKKVSSIVLNVFLLLLGIVTVYPFIWMLCSSFKQNKEIMALQQHLLPQEFTIDNYISMNSHFNFMRFLETVCLSRLL